MEPIIPAAARAFENIISVPAFSHLLCKFLSNFHPILGSPGKEEWKYRTKLPNFDQKEVVAIWVSMWYTYRLCDTHIKQNCHFVYWSHLLEVRKKVTMKKKKWLQGVKYQEQSIISLSGKKATTCGPHICMAIGIRIPGFQFATR